MKAQKAVESSANNVDFSLPNALGGHLYITKAKVPVQILEIHHNLNFTTERNTQTASFLSFNNHVSATPHIIVFKFLYKHPIVYCVKALLRSRKTDGGGSLVVYLQNGITWEQKSHV